MVIKSWVCFFFLISMSWHKLKFKPLRTVGCRASGVSSNLGEVCREVRDQFRGPFIRGMSTGGSLAIGSWVDLETRSESSRMESAAEISQAVHWWHWMPFWVMVVSPVKNWFPSPPAQGRAKAPAGGEEEQGMWLTPLHSQAQGWQRAQTFHRSPAQQLSV